MWERSAALKGLPGPKYGILGLVHALLSKQPHRWTTIWADLYGPIVRLRVLCFHVSPAWHRPLDTRAGGMASPAEDMWTIEGGWGSLYG